MKIKNLTFLNDYKQFKKGDSFIFSSEKNSLLSNDDLTISVLVGRNGSGKTTLMSLISTLFHFLERYRNRIPADFEFTYLSNWSKQNNLVKLAHQNNIIRISVSGKFDNVQLLPKKNPREDDLSLINKNETYIRYSEIRDYLPFSVVSSTFSMHGEYPVGRPNNYIGDRIVSDQSITHIYGKNHYKIGSISRGILLFIKLFFDGSNNIKELLDLFDLKFSNRILIYNYQADENWVKVDKKWISKNDSNIQHQDVYINDIEFERNGRKITLANMSSGEKMLLLRTITILNSIEEDSIVIIEEPELHLDAVWNKQLTTLFEVIFSGYKSHLLIATHNYSIINSVPKTNLIYLQNGIQSLINESTFLASYDELFRILYGEKFKSNKIEEEFLSGLSDKSIDELQLDFERVGNSVFKYLIFKKIKEKS